MLNKNISDVFQKLIRLIAFLGIFSGVIVGLVLSQQWRQKMNPATFDEILARCQDLVIELGGCDDLFTLIRKQLTINEKIEFLIKKLADFTGAI